MEKSQLLPRDMSTALSMIAWDVPNRVIKIQEGLSANVVMKILKIHIFVIKYPVLEMLFGTSSSHPWVCSA